MIPSQLDTTREDWRMQARGKGNCKSCNEEVLWCWFDDAQGDNVKRPYNYSDGKLHFATCPERHAFRTAQPKASESTHKCPVSTCELQVPKKHLMCKWHWVKVDETTRKEVIEGYQAGDRPRWHAAMKLAIEQAEPKKKPEPKPQQKQAALFDAGSQGYGVD